ncbi:MAG TPA: type II secretion system F family protein [Thiobacillaceae bacterium]|nr:type II secretion system F family protein [Thiobacillaceae bacterium]HNA81770.1 type II secretion system F family protein [Thiobacillaceae bacterium]HNF87715.1 type II secretion system F family protein [Thiobacillaceae bacterium]HNH88561.1 type II secretion system F family protein [Thiobacillaceae bacterium]
MPRFRYVAADNLGNRVQGELSAINDIDLDLRLRRTGVTLIRARPVNRRALFNRGRASRRDLISFCFHMQQIARAGASLLEGLKDLIDSTENSRFRDLLSLLADDLEGGKLLSESLASHPDVFDRVFVALVKAAEQSDQMETVFARLEARLKQQEELQTEFTRLLIYPSLAAVAVLAAASVLLFHLTPKLAMLVSSLNLPMPLTTRVLIAVSDLVRTHAFWVLPGIALLVGAAALAPRRYPRLADKRDELLLRMPALGSALRKRILARVTGLMALLLQSGVGFLDALQACADSAGNRIIRRKLQGAGQLIASGCGVSESLGRQDIFPPLVQRMIHTGESNGALPEALENVAWFFDRDSKETITRALKLLEPAMAALLGLLLAIMLISVFMPIYQIIGELPL